MLEHDPAKLSFNAWRRSSARLAEFETALMAARIHDAQQVAALAAQVQALRASTSELYAAATAAARHSRGRKVRRR